MQWIFGDVILVTATLHFIIIAIPDDTLIDDELRNICKLSNVCVLFFFCKLENCD